MLNQVEFCGDIHDPENEFFGYTIKSPTDIDHYTDEDISNMIEYLDYNGVATFPLQMIINIINHLGGQHFWHEVNSYEDMDAYYSREMLEEMKECGFNYVARIRSAADNMDALKTLHKFVTLKMREYSIGDKNELQAVYFNYVEDFAKKHPALPRMNCSIIFSTVPIIAKDGDNILLPIVPEILKLKNLEKRSAELEEQRDQAAINYLTSNGMSMAEAQRAVESGKEAQYGNSTRRRG